MGRKLEAITVAEFVGDELRPAGEVRFGIGRGLRGVLEEIRTSESGRIIRVQPEIAAAVKFFGRHRSGAIRDGVIEAIERL